MSLPHAILTYWFADIATNPAASESRMKLWFGKDSEVDQHLRETYAGDINKAMLGEYDGWMSSADGGLALIIMLDQFSRNIFRDTEKMFSQDRKALALAKEMVRSGLHEQLNPYQKLFCYLPYEHSEALMDQADSIVLYEKLHQEVSAEQKAFFKNVLDYAYAHQRIIQRFSRFPHRNAILKRESSAEEEAFLQEPGSSF